MNTNQQIFTGVFVDEIGQRFLRIFTSATDNAFKEVCENFGFSSRLQECLMKVPQWDNNVIEEEYSKLNSEFKDFEHIFKQTYKKKKKMMRGGGQVKIMVNLPKIELVLKSYLAIMSNNKFMKDGKYFDRSQIEQRSICMECIRDSLYEFLGEEYVKIQERKKKRTYKPPPSIAEDESYHSDEDSIIPDDSISSVGYHERKKNNVEEDDRQSSASLSSVSLSQVSRKEYKGINNEEDIDNSEENKHQVNDEVNETDSYVSKKQDDTKSENSYVSRTKEDYSGQYTKANDLKQEERNYKKVQDENRSAIDEKYKVKRNRKYENDNESEISLDDRINIRGRVERSQVSDNSKILDNKPRVSSRMPEDEERSRGIMSDHRMSDHRSRTSGNRSRMSDNRSQISDNQSQISDNRSRISDNRSRISDNRSRISDRSEISDKMSEVSDRSELSANDRISNYKNRRRYEHDERKRNQRNNNSDSSEEDIPRQRASSPCKSYVTSLTEDSKMTCEK